MGDWSNLPEELLNFIAVRLFSIIELRRFRSICTSWCSSAPGVDNSNNCFPSRPLIHFNPIAPGDILENDEIFSCEPGTFLLHTAFFRVTLSSSPSKGWIIKSDLDIINSGTFSLLHPLSLSPLCYSSGSLDLLEYTVSEIREAYVVLDDAKVEVTSSEFQRSALVKVKEGEDHHNGVLGIGRDGYITYWNGNVLTKLEQMGDHFSDIIVHKGVTYVLDSQGIVWLLNSDLEISRYGTSVDENITNGCWGDMNFVEGCKELFIVERLPREYPPKRKSWIGFNYSRTVGFKVFKMDEESSKWVEVKTLGENAFVMAPDTCFSIVANEFYGCLQNSIYFTENLWCKVFKLDNGNGSIIKSKSEKISFQMFYPSFL